jgi:hypothetical protein
MQALWSANTSVAHCDAGTMDGGVHLITQDLHLRVDGCPALIRNCCFFKDRYWPVPVIHIVEIHVWRPPAFWRKADG